MGCINPAKMSSLLLNFTDEFAVLIDYKPHRLSSYDPATGTATLASPTSIPDIRAMIQWDQVLTKGSDYLVDKGDIVIFIAKNNISIIPSPNDRFEFPALSERDNGFKSYSIRSVDVLRAANTILGYAMRAGQ